MSQFIEVQQGSKEWLQARATRITASRFVDALSRINELDEKQQKYVTAIRHGATVKEACHEAGYRAEPTAVGVIRAIKGENPSEPSDIAKRYAADLAIERISGVPHGEPPKAWVLDRGHEMEAKARMIYEARTGAFVTESGICISDDGIFSYSSDGLVNDDGLIEIKSPIDSIKIMEMWRDGDVSEYRHQMQGGMWITGRKWCDFIMYVPDLAAVGKDLYVKRIMRDDEFIDAMVLQLAQFDQMVQLYEGVFRAPAEGAVDADFTEVQTNEEPMQQETPQTILPLLIEEPAPAPTTAAEAVTQALELARADAAPSAELPGLFEQAEIAGSGAALEPATPPTLKLGDISARLGFTVTADFLLSLGFAPAATEKNSKLFHEGQFPLICGAIIKHVTAVANQFIHQEESEK